MQMSADPVPAPRSSRRLGCGLLIALLVVLVIGIPVISGISNYNRFVTLEKTVDKKWADIESALKRRSDLIPNLVATVRAYAKHEEKVLTEVTRARAGLDNAKGVEEISKASGDLSQALSRLMVVVEAYPQLLANENFLQLQAQLEGTENRLDYARREYNEAVQAFNTAIKRFPGVIFAGLFGFKEEKKSFEATEAERQTPDVGKMLEE